MNKEMFYGRWNEFKGKVKQQWGKLTDDDVTQISGKRDELLGKLQTRYGYTKEKAEQELVSFEDSCCGKEPCCEKKEPCCEGEGSEKQEKHHV